MKKTLLIVLAGIMMFAFTQCGGGKSSNENTENTENTETDIDDEDEDDIFGDDDLDLSDYSEEFRDNYGLFVKLIDYINEAETCEDMEGLVWVMIGEAFSLGDKEYAEDQKMTEEEEELLNKIGEDFQKAMEEKQAELGCEEEETEGDGDDIWGDWDEDEDEDEGDDDIWDDWDE